MGFYNYKLVRDQIPERIMAAGGYEGTADYDGDLWCAAADYIAELEQALKAEQAFEDESVKENAKEPPPMLGGGYVCGTDKLIELRSTADKLRHEVLGINVLPDHAGEGI